jgi:hypothetical protein
MCLRSLGVLTVKQLLIASLIGLSVACGGTEGGTIGPTAAADRCEPNPCQNGGTCSDNGQEFSCDCRPGYSGGTCQINIDDCTPNPCQNNGVCSDAVNSFSCSCAPGFNGTTCGSNRNECKDDPCQHGGTCNDAADSYTCSCEAGYRGKSCELDTDDCALNPCRNGAGCRDQLNGFSCDCTAGNSGNLCDNIYRDCSGAPCSNGASCSDTPGGYRCNCAPGYSGVDCQIDVDDCAPNPCQNGSTCHDRPNGYFCECAPGYSGAQCATDFNECGNNPCKNGALCIDQIDGYKCSCASGYRGPTCESDVKDCSPDPCKNGGECKDAVNGFSCQCLLGYHGTICDNSASDCSSDPCQNGGACSDTDEGFVCSCAPGFYGYTCQHDIDDCSPNPCQNGGACTDQVNGFGCSCARGWSGTTCATNIDDCLGEPCQNGGTCVDEVDGFGCACPPGYAGELCQDCAAAFQDRDGDGRCLGDCSDGGERSCSGHGGCDDSTGSPICSCEVGYSGARCESCARGYQDKDADHTCSATCDGASLGDCSGRGTCSDASGGAACQCNPGYAGSVCQDCAPDHQDNDGDGICEPDCAGAGLTGCSGHGLCSDLPGQAACSCGTGYTGERCAECASGYQDLDQDGVCNPSCSAAALSCGPRGTCADSGGSAVCVCDTAYSGPTCSECAGSYQDNDHNGSCLPSCASALLSCSAGAACSDTNGNAGCVCLPGYTGNGILCTVTLVARWTMDAGMGSTLHDSSGNDNGATAYVAGWATGQFGHGFSGRAMTDNPLPALSGTTISAWVKKTDFGNGTPRFLSMQDDVLELGEFEHSGRLGVNIAGLGWQDTGQGIPSGWNHVAVSTTTGITRLYWNGGLLRSYESAPINLSQKKLGLNRHWNGDGQDWNGVIDEVRVYGGALSDGAIQELASAIPPAGLAAHYDAQDLNSVSKDPSGVVMGWGDLSGNARNLTVSGSAPTYDPVLINDRPGLNFGGKRRLSTSPFPISTEITLFAVIQQRTPDLRGAIAHHGNHDLDWSLEQSGSEAPGELHFQSNSDDAAVELTLNSGVNYVLWGRISGNHREFSASSPSGTVSTSGEGVSIESGSKVMYVGSSDTDDGSNAYIGELIYYNRAVTPAESEQVLDYLRARWGI